MLRLRGFGVAFGERVVLSSVTLDVPSHGVLVLMGPSGTGKSTLLRTLAGFNDGNPSLHTWGAAYVAGQPLTQAQRPALVAQSARLLMASVFENVVHELPQRGLLQPLESRALARELLVRAGLGELAGQLDQPAVKLSLANQRHLAILRVAAAQPRLLCIDEPTAGLDEAAAGRLLDYIRSEATRRAVWVVVHNQAHARRLGGQIALLAGGRIQEYRAVEAFFSAPRTPAAREFVRSGGCSLPSPGARPEELDAQADRSARVPPAARVRSSALGPRGFLWLEKGRLAGTPQPGIVNDIHYDLRSLRRVGITHLVSLTRKPIPEALLVRHGLEGLWLPVPDMGAPGIDAAASLCRRIDGLCAAGSVVAVHCRAGRGRTGMMLAAQLIWEGASALSALESVRRIEPRWVQSEAQVAFLERFAQAVRAGGEAPA